jgi:hypothetical protein
MFHVVPDHPHLPTIDAIPEHFQAAVCHELVGLSCPGQSRRLQTIHALSLSQKGALLCPLGYTETSEKSKSHSF